MAPVTTSLPFCTPSRGDSFICYQLRKISWRSGAGVLTAALAQP